jgi:hypothetical protein
MNKRLILVLLGVMIPSMANALLPDSVQAQVRELRNSGRAFQRMSKFKSYDECLRHNLKGMAGDTRRASKWCSRQGYLQ